LNVKYRENPKELTSNDFWTPIRNGTKRDGTPFLDPAFVTDVELYRTLILNPLSHSRIVTTPQRDIDNAIKMVEELERRLRAIV
ncbi:MAG: hypothetical protein HYR94_06245, partial [Chloroflexi bacterium]|nr:hypothetical protein [Chloroflexota bacterium]